MQSTIINLLEIFKQHVKDQEESISEGINSIREILKKGRPLQGLTQEEKAIVANNSFFQLSYKINKNPTVVFIKDSSTLELVNNWSDLAEVELDEEQQRKVQAFLETKKDDPNFYNGKHFAVENMLHDATKNIIYIQAKATDYATMSAVPEVISKDCFRLGVISPIITSDSKTYLLERNDLLKLWSSFGGFVERIDESLNDLVKRNAEKEATEEILDTQSTVPIAEVNCISMRGLLQVFQKISPEIPTMEFFAPIRINITSDMFEKIYLNNNCAKDRKEHTVVNSKIINGIEYVAHKRQEVDLLNLNSILNAMYDNKAGDFLYKPLIISALEAIGVNVSTSCFENVTKIPVGEFAQRLFESNNKIQKSYQLTPETLYLSEIVKRILETNSEIKIAVLTDEIVEAALEKKDDNYDIINELWGIHKACLMQTVDNKSEWIHYVDQNKQDFGYSI